MVKKARGEAGKVTYIKLDLGPTLNKRPTIIYLSERVKIMYNCDLLLYLCKALQFPLANKINHEQTV